MVRLSGRPIALAFAAFLAAFAVSAPALADGVAFAKASPLTVYDSPDFQNGKNYTFDFGVAYPVVERTGTAVVIKLNDGTTGYLKAAHVVVEDRARYIVSSPAFKSKERPALRFWESQASLNDFLGSADSTQPTDDYRELIGDAPPDFSIKLPVFNVDMSDSEVLGSQVPMAEVLLPIPRAAYDKFEEVKEQGGTALELYFVLDASGSTDGFLQQALADIVAALKENATVAGKIGKISVTLFGANLKNGAEKVGTLEIADLAGDKWYPADYRKKTDGDSEPLAAGLAALDGAITPAEGSSVVIVVLSGADVMPTVKVAALGKEVGVADLEPAWPSDAAAVFGQVTPEPGTSLADAAKAMPGISSPRYVGFSATLGKDVVAAVLAQLGRKKNATIEPREFAAVADIAHKAQMLAILPARLTSSSTLPRPQTYVDNADWYTVRLWLPIDRALLSQSDN